jgi:hypothetical protein
MRKREFKHAEKLFFLLRVRTHLSIPPTPKGPASFLRKITFRVLLLLSQKFRLAPDEMEHTQQQQHKSLEEDTEEAGLNLEEEKAAVAARSPTTQKLCPI